MKLVSEILWTFRNFLNWKFEEIFREFCDAIFGLLLLALPKCFHWKLVEIGKFYFFFVCRRVKTERIFFGGEKMFSISEILKGRIFEVESGDICWWDFWVFKMKFRCELPLRILVVEYFFAMEIPTLSWKSWQSWLKKKL